MRHTLHGIQAAVVLMGILGWLSATCSHAETDTVAQARFKATDSEQAWTDTDTDTQTALDQFKWDRGEFEVRCIATPGQAYDALVGFPSPIPTGKPWIDEVVLVWYATRGEDGHAIEAPAVLMAHSLHPRMVVSDLIARQFAERGLHAFVLQLPGYGYRMEEEPQYPGVGALEHGRQAIADFLRARDAIAALPNIKPGPIALQGTSLGGFVAATVGGVEASFDPVILLISGADGYGTLTNGQHDAERLRLALERKGYRDDALRDLLEPIEPLRVAHRLDPARTWLISARHDMTIPRASSDALAEAVGLEDPHRVWFNGNHYTSLAFLPYVSDYMAGIILAEPDEPIQPLEMPED